MHIYRITHVTQNPHGKVVYTDTEPLGTAQVEDVQEVDKHPISAMLHITNRVDGAEIKAGSLVKSK